MKNADDTGLDMTMISVFYDANINPLRKVATKNAIKCWMKQRHLPKEMVFIELGFNDKFTFQQSDFPSKIKYTRIDGNDSHKYLFQKEHLWNIGAKRAKYEKLMFVDSDIAPQIDIDWFKKIYVSLNKCLFTQGFTKLTYLKQDGSHDTTTTSHPISSFDIQQKKGAPGGVYCMRKSALEAIGWFNYIPFGGGDDLFWSEIFGKPNTLTLLVCKRMGVCNTLRLLAKCANVQVVSSVNAEVFHFYHGERKMRSYSQRQYMLLTQYPWMGRLMKDDDLGLLAWIDTKHYFYNVASKLHTVNNSQVNANNLLKDHLAYNEFCSMLRNKTKSDDRPNTQELAWKFVKDAAKLAVEDKDKIYHQTISKYWFG